MWDYCIDIYRNNPKCVTLPKNAKASRAQQCAFLQHNFDHVNATLKMCDYCIDTYRNNPICVAMPKKVKASRAIFTFVCIFATEF